MGTNSVSTSYFKKELKIIKKRQKDLKKLDEIVEKLANKEKLDKKYGPSSNGWWECGDKKSFRLTYNQYSGACELSYYNYYIKYRKNISEYAVKAVEKVIYDIKDLFNI